MSADYEKKEYESNGDRAKRLEWEDRSIRRPHESGYTTVVRPKSERPKKRKPVVRKSR